MNEYKYSYRLSTTSCGDEGQLSIDLESVAEFPVCLSNDELWDKVVAKVGERRAREDCLCAWTNLKKNHFNIDKRGRFVISTNGGYSDEAGSFVGYAIGMLVESGGPACLWGDSDASGTEFSMVKGSGYKAVFAVCRSEEGGFWLKAIWDRNYLKLADALGVEFEDLIIAS